MAGRSRLLPAFTAASRLPQCSASTMPMCNHCLLRSVRTLLATPTRVPVGMGPAWVLRHAGLIRVLLRCRPPVSLAMPDEISCGDRDLRNSTQRCTKISRSLNDGRLRLEWKLITCSTIRILVFRVIHKVRFPWEVPGMPSSRMRRVISPLTLAKSSPPPAPRARFSWSAGLRFEERLKPMAASSNYVLEPIRNRAEFTLYRGRQRGNPMPLLAVAPTTEPPPPQSLRRLEHEHSLAAELEPA